MAEKVTISDKIAKLNEKVEWFYSDDFSLEKDHRELQNRPLLSLKKSKTTSINSKTRSRLSIKIFLKNNFVHIQNNYGKI